jgi:hypothetical protein
MRRWLIQAPILILTFAAGFGIATYRAHRNTIKPATTFTCDGIVTAFRSHYHSSDGQDLRYGCYDHGLLSEAERSLQDQINKSYRYAPDGNLTKVGIVKRTATLDADRKKVSERVVLDNGTIYWTEGTRYHLIHAPSVEYAVLFEKSRAWAWEGCMKLPPRDKGAY